MAKRSDCFDCKSALSRFESELCEECIVKRIENGFIVNLQESFKTYGQSYLLAEYCDTNPWSSTGKFFAYKGKDLSWNVDRNRDILILVDSDKYNETGCQLKDCCTLFFRNGQVINCNRSVRVTDDLSAIGRELSDQYFDRTRTQANQEQSTTTEQLSEADQHLISIFGQQVINEHKNCSDTVDCGICDAIAIAYGQWLNPKQFISTPNGWTVAETSVEIPELTVDQPTIEKETPSIDRPVNPVYSATIGYNSATAGKFEKLTFTSDSLGKLRIKIIGKIIQLRDTQATKDNFYFLTINDQVRSTFVGRYFVPSNLAGREFEMSYFLNINSDDAEFTAIKRLSYFVAKVLSCTHVIEKVNTKPTIGEIIDSNRDLVSPRLNMIIDCELIDKYEDSTSIELNSATATGLAITLADIGAHTYQDPSKYSYLAVLEKHEHGTDLLGIFYPKTQRFEINLKLVNLNKLDRSLIDSSSNTGKCLSTLLDSVKRSLEFAQSVESKLVASKVMFAQLG